MALNKAVVHIPLGGGKNEGVHEHLIEAPKVADLRNCHFDKQGTLTKRFGFKALSSTDEPNWIHSIFSYDNSVHAITEDSGIHYYSKKDKLWFAPNNAKNGVSPFEVSNKHVYSTDLSVYKGDVAICNGFVCYTWEYNDQPWFMIEEEKSELLRVEPRPLNMGPDPRVSAIEDRYFVIFSLTNDPNSGLNLRLGAVTIDTENDFSVSSIKKIADNTDPESITDFPATHYDIHTFPSCSAVYGVHTYQDIFNAHDPLETETYVWRFQESGFDGQTLLSGNIYNSHYGRAIWHDADNTGKAFIATMTQDPLGVTPTHYEVQTTRISTSLDGSGELGYEFPTLAIASTSGSVSPRLTGSYLSIGRQNSLNVGVASSAFFSVFSAQSNFGSTNLWATTKYTTVDNNNTKQNTYDASKRNLHLAAKLFQVDAGNNPRNVLPLEYHYTISSSVDYQNTQPTLIYGGTKNFGNTIDSDHFKPLAKNNTDVSFNRFNTKGFLSHVVSSSYRGWIHASTILDRVLGSTNLFPNQRDHVRTEIRECRLNLANSPLVAKKWGPNVLINGGYLANWDGSISSENNIFLYPFFNGAEVQAPVTGSNFHKGCVVHKYTDANGIVHRSKPSNVAAIRQGEALTASYQPPEISAFEGEQVHKITTEFYLTPTTESNTNPSFHLVREFPYERRPEGFAAPYWVEGIYDYTDPNLQELETRPILYTEGDILESTCPAAFVDFTVAKNRVFGISQENRRQVWYSKLFEPGIAPEFNGNLVITDNTGDEQDFVAIAHFQQKILLFKPESIYYLAGNGPNNAGAGQPFIGPTLVADSIGCINKHSVQETPVGVTFQSNEGIYLYNGSLSYIGQSVEDTLGDRKITSTLVNEKESQIIFVTNSDLSLVYDYKRKEWTIYDIYADHAAMVNNSLTLMSGTNNVSQQTSDYYLDAHETGMPQSFETGWIKPANLQGFGRLWKISLLGKKGEHTVTNLIKYSEDLLSWDSGNAGGGPSTTTTPTGYGSAFQVVDFNDSVTEAVRLADAATLKPKIEYTWSAFVKKDTNTDRFPAFRLWDGSHGFIVNVDTQNGQAQITSDQMFEDATNDITYPEPEASISSYDSDWWLLQMTFTTPSNTSVWDTYIYPAYASTIGGGADPTLTGDVIVFGNQIEKGSHFTQYVKTEGSTASHNTLGPLKISLYFNYDDETVHQTKYYDEYELNTLKRLQVAFMPKYQKIESFKLKLEELDSSDGKPGNVSGWRWSSIALEYGQDGGTYKYTTPNSLP